MKYRWIGIGLLFAPVWVWAQSMYVKDGATASVYTGLLQQPPVITTLKAGSKVETLERIEDEFKIRLSDGQEGFVAVAALVAKKPTSPLLVKARQEVQSAKKEIAQLREQLKKLQDQMESQKQTTGAAEVEKTQANGATGRAPQWKTADFVWLGISFAMLIIGIGIGAWWVKEVHRRKMGGMHIRISGM